MAQLPRYNLPGASLISGDVPRIDFSPMAENTNYAKTITNAVDRIAEFAFKSAQAAQDKENKMVAIQSRMQMEADLQVQNATIVEKIESGEYDSVEQIQNDFAKFRGGAAALSGYSAEQANGLMNSVNTFSKAAILAFGKRKSSQILANRDTTVDNLIDTVTVNIGTAIENLDNDSDRLAYITGASAVVEANASLSSSPAQKMAEYQKQLKIQIGSTLAKHFSSTEFAPNMTIAMAKLGKEDGGKYAEFWNQMTPQQKAAVKLEMKKSFSDATDVKKAQLEASKFEDEAESRGLIADYFKNPKPETLRKLETIAIRSNAVSPEYVAELPNKAATAEPRNIVGEMTLKDEIDSGLIKDLPTLQQRGMELRVGVRRISELQDRIYKSEKSVSSAVEKIARQQAKLVPGMMNVTRAQTEDYYSFLNQVEKAFESKTQSWESGGRVGAPPSKVEIANGLVTKKRESTFSKRIETQSADLANKYGINGSIHKSAVVLEELRLNYRDDGTPTGISPDSISALRAAKYTDAHIQEIEQILMGIDRNKEALRAIQ